MSSRTTKYNLSGDKEYAKRLKGLADIQLNNLRNLMKFNKLKQYSLTMTDTSGFVIQTSSVFGVEVVNIYFPINKPQEDIKKLSNVVLMIWDKFPEFTLDNNGDKTDIINTGIMLDDPLVTGGHYATISVINSTVDGVILPATFIVKQQAAASGWSVKQGVRQPDGSYKLDGKSATLLIGANAKGRCKVFAVDNITALEKDVRIISNKFFLMDVSEMFYYAASELGEGINRHLTFDTVGSFVAGQTEFMIVSTNLTITGYSSSPAGTPTNGEGTVGEIRWMYSTVTTTRQSTTKVVERYSQREVLSAVTITEVTEEKTGWCYKCVYSIFGNYWQYLPSDHRDVRTVTTTGNSYSVIKDVGGNPLFGFVAVKYSINDTLVYTNESDTFTWGTKSTVDTKDSTAVTAYIEYYNTLGLKDFSCSKNIHQVSSSYVVTGNNPSDSSSSSTTYSGRILNWFEYLDTNNYLAKYLVSNSVGIYDVITVEGIESGESFSYNIPIALADVGSPDENMNSVFNNIYYGKEII